MREDNRCLAITFVVLLKIERGRERDVRKWGRIHKPANRPVNGSDFDPVPEWNPM